jgi:hypothetical protein
MTQLLMCSVPIINGSFSLYKSCLNGKSLALIPLSNTMSKARRSSATLTWIEMSRQHSSHDDWQCVMY